MERDGDRIGSDRPFWRRSLTLGLITSSLQPALVFLISVFFLILSRLIVTRYDAAPMLVGFTAMLWRSTGRTIWGGFAASLGALLKVYPAVITLVGDWRRGERSAEAIAFILTATFGVLVWLSLCGIRGVSESIKYHSGRGFEYGSVGSGLQMLAAKGVDAAVVITRDHGSFSSVAPWSGFLLRWIFPLQAGTILAISWVFARRRGSETLRYSGAVVLAFIVTGKEISPQYLIWLIPFMAALDGPIGRRSSRLFASVCVLTLLAPSCLNSLPRTSLGVIVVYNVRNILIVWLLILLVFGATSPGAHNDQGAADNGRLAPVR